MSLASKRIILVGDHRQLPHLLERNIELKLEELSEEDQEKYRMSLFHKLFQDMKEREREDGIKRTVTLDVQYRMHPVLGDFVSNTFYARYDEGFKSGLPAENFIHGIERYGDALGVWVDLPHRKGAESGGISKCRKCEATWIAEETLRILEGHPHLSVGVITFYSAQEKELYDQMETLGIFEIDDLGNRRVAERFRFTESSILQERLRVGTVDAFQGMEFDVVLLSMTRSNKHPVSKENPKTWRRKFGHLMLENRLCVAMSRQKRLLLTVDKGMLGENIAKEAVRIGRLQEFLPTRTWKANSTLTSRSWILVPEEFGTLNANRFFGLCLPTGF